MGECRWMVHFGCSSSSILVHFACRQSIFRGGGGAPWCQMLVAATGYFQFGSRNTDRCCNLGRRHAESVTSNLIWRTIHAPSSSSVCTSHHNYRLLSPSAFHNNLCRYMCPPRFAILKWSPVSCIIYSSEAWQMVSFPQIAAVSFRFPFCSLPSWSHSFSSISNRVTKLSENLLLSLVLQAVLFYYNLIAYLTRHRPNPQWIPLLTVVF